MNLANFNKATLFTPVSFTVKSIMDRSNSWMNPACKNDDLLMHWQITFNIYELHARKLRKDLSLTKFGPDPTDVFNEKYNLSMPEMTDYLNTFKVETKLGTDIEKLKEWDIK